jgi:transcriptional regulator with XRE-family HTH domain
MADTQAVDGLGGALRVWRERLGTSDVGLPSWGNRRVAGLRREEVAGLAGVSVDYLVRLEQGRALHPSLQVAQSLARALRLNDTERDHLLQLAGLADTRAGAVPDRITPGVQRLLDRFGDAPVAVLDAAWNLLAWNPLWAALLGDPSSWHGRERNLVWRAFTDCPSRVVLTETEHAQWRSGLVADLRLVCARYPTDWTLSAMIDELNSDNAAFASLWAAGGVGVQAAARKTFLHPEVGPLTLDCDVLVVQGTDLRVVAYTAAQATPDAHALALLNVLGLQTVH